MARLPRPFGRVAAGGAPGLRVPAGPGRHLLTRARALLAAAALLGAAAPARAAVEVLSADAAAAATAAAQGFLVRRFDAGALNDPIATGRLLARLQGAEAVIVVGADAASWAARELEGLPVYFAGGAARVPGGALASRGWAGSVSYPLKPLLDFARSSGWRRLGVLATPAYRPLVHELQAAARGRGLAVSARTPASPSEVPAAFAAAAEGADALWVLGDPLLTRGAGGEYILETALARGLPVLAPEEELLLRGAYAAWRPAEGADAAGASAAARAAADGSLWAGPALRFGPDEGSVVVNEVLKRRWGRGAGKGGR